MKASTASFGEATRIALESLRASKLRSFLTLLGIILATATLISVTALIHGMNLYVANKVSSMGADGFQIVRVAWLTVRDPKQAALMDKRNPLLRMDEYEFIRDHATLLSGIGVWSQSQGRVGYQGQSTSDVNIQGITANVPSLQHVDSEYGREISDDEVRRHAAVAFSGADLKTKYFENRDPIGKIVDVEGLPFQVVGVAKARGSVFGSSQDDFVMVPIGQFRKLFPLRRGLRFIMKASGEGQLMQAQDQVRSLLRAYRHLRPTQEDNFGILTSDSLVNLWTELTAAIAGTAIAIVSVFMVVGGIVIMNIMLAAVTERTHEIGIRKSLGARRADILNQFLVESATLALVGGVIGVLISWILTLIIRSTAPVPMAMPFFSVLIGLGLSTIVGLFFGIYPAQKASKLDPIEALRTER